MNDTADPGSPRIAVEPKSGRFESLEEAVVDGGGSVVGIEDAEALVWADPSVPERLPELLARAESAGSVAEVDGPALVRWVGLPFAGIEPYVDYLDDKRIWTCAKGVYARPVAEHALMLGLAGLRGLADYARAETWRPPRGHNLLDATVAILGAGGITDELISLLQPFNCTIKVVRRRGEPVDGASMTVAFEDRLRALDGADLVVLALALTPETEGVMGADEFSAMADHGWLVNVARGAHVDVDALRRALESGAIGGACLDVTDPEPLPDGHWLWTHPGVIITPHIANTPEMGVPLLADHIRTNVARFARGHELDGLVDVNAGY